MKTYIYIVTILIALTLPAQEVIVPLEQQLTYENHTDTPIYFKDVNNLLDKYTGNWVFDDGTHYLKITVTKNNHLAKGWPPHYNNPDFEDDLSITMIYKMNGVEVYNTNSVPPQHPLINGNIIRSTNKIELQYYEPTSSCKRYKDADLILEYVMETQPNSLPLLILQWNRVNRLSYISPQSECPDGTLIDASDFVIPAQLTLVRE